MSNRMTRILMALMVVAAMALASVVGTGSAQAQTDRENLVILYNATDGPNWTNSANWLSDRPLGEWHGVTTDANGRVTELQLSDNRLNGQLPSSPSSLANLQRLSLDRNQLSGQIPAELGSLANLQVLLLHNNQLSGQIPPELGSLANLQVLFLGGNQLSGQIPPELGNLANLQLLMLWDTQLSGQIPAELGSLANLQVLFLGSNQLSGQIPSSLGSLANLQDLSLYNNQLTGEIPAELGSLANLQELGLYYNQLSGQIPSSLGSLANLQVLYLYYNQFTGVLPSNFTQLAALEQFAFYGNSGLCAPTDATFQNWLTAIPNNDLPPRTTPLGPNCSPALTDREILVILYNATDGPNWTNSANWLSDRPLGEWHGMTTDANGRVTELRLTLNQLKGALPPEIANLTNLQVLALGGNQLTGRFRPGWAASPTCKNCSWGTTN